MVDKLRMKMYEYPKMQMLTKQINAFGAAGTPFVFLVDYEMQAPKVWTLDEIDPTEIGYDFNGFTNFEGAAGQKESPLPFLDKFPISYKDYQLAFDEVQAAIRRGDTYLANLTFPTRILTSLDLREIVERAKAPYRFWWKNRFALFSPESFVKIQAGTISSFPMKGTLSANIPNAKQVLLDDPKEKAEHATITDLIRNDLSRVAKRVHVKRYRYLEEIQTNEENLLQTSSEIVGELPADYKSKLGCIIAELLPAGSISGAPKRRTVEVLRHAEKDTRAYYTGVLGYFDGENLDTAVAIRFIEQKEGQLFYRSGGGITNFSQAHLEYEEMIQKIYLPSWAKTKPLSTP